MSIWDDGGVNTLIGGGIEAACAEMDDEKIIYNPLVIKSDTSAANGHPAASAQIEWGKELADFIEK